MNEQPSSARIALKWGGILGLVLILITLIMYMTNPAGNPSFSVLTLVAMVGFLVLGLQEYRRANEGFLTYGEGMSIGALLSAVAGLLSSAFITFYNVVIDPTIQQRTIEGAREQLEKQGMDDDQIDKAMELAQKFQSPGFVFVSGVFGTIIMGVLLTLIVAAVLRRNRPLF
ncbi:DUF4199 domain-containing protein [Spirosoma rhododendri]|uniref:DUF4199 domain-containing protein n=1 Tax=Spirosoma rhododendri TaxID=2728024 RepID=A0A7L5DJN3_9BACT|nr:DUF4199 domain-containing protein [Spirosoma rhododendri]QJD77333.1 DUF4199 domain-containing protein [Spirosoma rhododendri]